MTMDSTPAPYVRSGDPRWGSTRDKTFRGVLQLRTPEGETGTMRELLDKATRSVRN
ncbi:MAG: hypothetical protein WBF75_25700 [Pseudonocardiaceae bacterium]